MRSPKKKHERDGEQHLRRGSIDSLMCQIRTMFSSKNAVQPRSTTEVLQFSNGRAAETSLHSTQKSKQSSHDLLDLDECDNVTCGDAWVELKTSPSKMHHSNTSPTNIHRREARRIISNTSYDKVRPMYKTSSTVVTIECPASSASSEVLFGVENENIITRHESVTSISMSSTVPPARRCFICEAETIEILLPSPCKCNFSWVHSSCLYEYRLASGRNMCHVCSTTWWKGFTTIRRSRSFLSKKI